MIGKIACIILNYNDWKRTSELVESIIHYEAISHIIVVDNHSTDESSKLLSRLNNLEKVELVFTTKNRGYGGGNNVGIRKAAQLGCKYALISNPDVIFSEECIINLAEALNYNSEYAIVSGIETNIGISGWKELSKIELILRNSVIFSKILDKKRIYPRNYFIGKKIVPVDIVPGCFFLTRIDLFIKYGMFDEHNFMYFEEEILQKKFENSGYIFGIVGSAKYQHMHVDGKDMKSRVFVAKNMNTSTRYLLNKYYNVEGVSKLFIDIFLNCIFLENLTLNALSVLKRLLLFALNEL